MAYIYFDYAATTPISDSARDAINNAMEFFGNPSSVHSAGMNAKRLIDSARKSIANALCAKPDEIIFTSCGSESNNQALNGLYKLRNRRSKRIITTDSEHPSVANTIKNLEASGAEIIKIGSVGGELDLVKLEEELKLGAAFVSIMLVNNETGAKYDIASVRKLIDRSGSGAYFHCDAVQGFLKTDSRREIAKNCDTASISAHKIGGLKGVGALYIKSGIKMPAFILGGGQEASLRSGTENTVGIAAFGAAAEAFTEDKLTKIAEKYDYLVSKLREIENIKLNIPKNHVNTILSVSIPGVRSEVMLNALSLYDICISAGSACSARKGPSGALTAYGLTKGDVESTVRISLGEQTTFEEIDILVEKIAETAGKLRR